MSFPVNPSSVGSQPQVVSLPQMQRIIQDIVDCVQQLKEDFSSSKSPITDDCQVLQRFCAKLEYLMQYDMKERFTLLGKRKDYWDFFCDCLASNRGANDGIKYVKALGEHKTSLGKGRAFIRFSLVHQRLADTLQQCSIHPKTGEWYNPGSMWLRQDVSSSIINTLYDLNGLHFDLSPRGYDLDNAWPSFARNVPGGGNWNVPISRRSSITSMDTLSLVSTDPSEISRLQQELASAETARSVLAENVTSLEQERQRAEQSVWMTQGELSALQNQLKSTGKKLEELQQKFSALELSHSQLQTEKQEKEKEVEKRAAELDAQQQQLNQEREQLAQQKDAKAQQVEKERAHFTTEVQTLRQNLIEVTDARDKMTSKVTSLEETLEQTRSWEAKKDQQIARLEQQNVTLEQRNKELIEEVAKGLSSREQDAASQLESAKKFEDILSKLKDVEAENVQLRGSVVELKHKSEVSEKAAEELRMKRDDLDSKLTTETQKCESLSSELKTLQKDLDRERASGTEFVEKLQAQITQAQAESDRTKAELTSTTEILTSTKAQQSHLTSFVSQLVQVVLNSSGAKIQTPDLTVCSESDMNQFVQACRQSSEVRFSDLQTRLASAEKEKTALTNERDTVQQAIDVIFNNLPEKPDNNSKELTQRAQEVETRVKSLCTQFSDMTTNNTFLKEQLQLAQGEQSDKGKQLSHLEGRLLELEKALKESRAAEGSLQGQVASMELTLKTTQQQNTDLQSQLQTSAADIAAKTESLQNLQKERHLLDQRSKDLEMEVVELKASVTKGQEQVEEKAASEQKQGRKMKELESTLEEALQELEEKRNQVTHMQAKLREGEDTVEKFLASMASLETDKASIITEHDTLQQQLTDVTSQLDTVIADKQQLQSDSQRLQQEMEQLLQHQAELKAELERKESEVKSLQESSLTSAQKHAEAVDQLKGKLESVCSELNQVKGQARETGDKLTEVTSLRKSAETERDAANKKLEQVSSELKEKEVAFSEQLHSLRVQLETHQTEKEELRKTSTSSQEEMTTLLTDKQNLISSLQQEKTALEKQVRDLSEQKQAEETDRERELGQIRQIN